MEEEEEEEDWKEEEDVEGRWIDVEGLFIRRSRMHTITAYMIDAYSQILHRRNETCFRSIFFKSAFPQKKSLRAHSFSNLCNPHKDFISNETG